MRCCHAWSGSASARLFNRGENVLRPLLAALGMLVAASAAAQSFTMKLAVPTVGDPNHEFIKRYKAAIEKNSGGRIKAELYPGGQLGASGLPVEYSQVLTALQQGAVDIIRANLVAMGTAKFYTVAKHVVLVDEGYIPEVAFVSTKFLDSLPPDLRSMVERTGRELE